MKNKKIYTFYLLLFTFNPANIAKLTAMLKSASKTITLFSLFMVPFLLEAQIMNIEKYRLDKDTSKIWMGNIGFGVASKKQQNTVNQYNANLNITYLSKHHSYMAINYFNLQQLNKASFISEGYAHIRLNFYRKNLISYEPYAQYQYDLGRGLLFRNLYGMSCRLNLFRNRSKEAKDKLNVGIATGLMYEEEFWKGNVLRFAEEGDSTHAHTRFIKSSTNIFVKAALHEKITLYGTIYYQARFEKFTYPRIVSDIQLVFKITKSLSFSTQFASTLDYLPIVTGNVFTYNFSGSFFLKLKD